MNKTTNLKLKTSTRLMTISLISFSLICISGCEALNKKFVRKHKGEQEKEVDVVFEPKEYPSQELSNDQLYQNHYLLWRSWKQELSEGLNLDTNSLVVNISYKRLLGESKEMITNLEAMKLLLQDEQQKGLVRLIQKAKAINDKIASEGLNNSDCSILKSNLETLERDVRKDYSYKKVKSFIKK